MTEEGTNEPQFGQNSGPALGRRSPGGGGATRLVRGADEADVRAERRPPANVTDDAGNKVSVDYGLVGDIREIRVDVVNAILKIPAISGR